MKFLSQWMVVLIETQWFLVLEDQWWSSALSSPICKVSVILPSEGVGGWGGHVSDRWHKHLTHSVLQIPGPSQALRGCPVLFMFCSHLAAVLQDRGFQNSASGEPLAISEAPPLIPMRCSHGLSCKSYGKAAMSLCLWDCDHCQLLQHRVKN